MSVCIALRNPDLTSKEIVACCDWKTSTESVSAETAFKFRYLSMYWGALWAGNDEVVEEVLGLYQRDLPALEDDKPLEALRGPLRQWRRRLAEAYIHDRLSLTLDDFYRNGKEWVDSGIRRDAQSGIATDYEQQKQKVQLILVGYVAGSLSIYLVSHGEVYERADLAAIGTGYAVAEAAIYWRMDRDEARGLDQTIYSVYEAKRLSEMSPYVGNQTTLFVIRPGEQGRLFFESHKGSLDLKSLEAKFKRFGPKPYKESKPLGK